MIGIFDSGVGGLSICRGVRNILPEENIIYLADEGNFPYGEKSKKELFKIVKNNVEFLVEKGADLIVIACNTATCHTIEDLRKTFDIPFVGVVPVVKTAASVTSNGKVGLLATKETIRSEYQKDLIKKFCSKVETYSVDGSKLIGLIEKGTDGISDDILKEVLGPLLKKEVDTIALGCTHYHFLPKRFQKIFPNITFLGSEGAVSRHVKTVVDAEDIHDKKKEEDLYYTSGDTEKLKKFLENILHIKGKVHAV